MGFDGGHSGRTVHRCVGCGTNSPETETNYTLISSRHGWRLVFKPGSDGRRVSEWRCPKCWADLKAQKE
ncbi:MAG TPA: hypothetical protein VM686_10530 [Polyangiaceae bacterium]|jgi:hypothetical protein|nr:hypothetical protein [Polyangiaceae bacterium]